MLRRILVIDDDATLHSCVRRLLTAAGYAALSAEDGNVGEQLARDERPDLVLLDMRMPGRTGLATLAALKAAPECAGIPVVMLSGSDEDFDDARRAGADGVLLKPFRQVELVSMIRPLLAAPPPVDPQNSIATPDVGVPVR